MKTSDSEIKNQHPYGSLPASAFWRSAIAEKHLSDIGPLWVPKFPISREDRVATFGSCFAQHIGRALKARNYNWLDTEPPPPMLSAKAVKEHNYEVFTCRTANIYTTTLLLQWTRWALGKASPPSEVWVDKGRYYDPFRPAIEPNGFESAEEMFRMRAVAIEAFAKAICTANSFVFTLGLTESWWNKREEYEYPTCPGTIAGVFNSEEHEFRNLQYEDVITSLRIAMNLMQSMNPKIKFVLTVSPVPLTASNSGNHVLVATMESKSILRAVAGQLARHRPNVVYFPSYEIINSPVTRGMFFEPNLRSVSPMGVNFVMEHFFGRLQDVYGKGGRTQVAPKVGAPQKAQTPPPTAASHSDVVCEEELLDAFRPA
jgi:GSCFA family